MHEKIKTPSEIILPHCVKCNELQPELLSLSKKENKLIVHTNNMSRHMSLWHKLFKYVATKKLFNFILIFLSKTPAMLSVQLSLGFLKGFCKIFVSFVCWRCWLRSQCAKIKKNCLSKHCLLYYSIICLCVRSKKYFVKLFL